MSRANPRFRRLNPPLPAAVANLFSLTVIGSLDNQLTVNTFYYADGGAALAGNSESNLANAFVSIMGAQFRAAISQDWTWTAVKVQCLTTPSRQPAVVTEALTGTGPAGHEPMQMGMVFIRKSGIKGQAGRGRITLPGLPTTWVAGSSLSAAGSTAAAAFVGLLSTAFISGGITYSPQVVSRKNKQGPALGASPVLVGTVSPQLGTIRRRKIGRGK